jgi:hypothetical protein
MRHAIMVFRLAICLAMLSVAPAFAQAIDDEATSNAATAPVAHVYIQTANGVNLYDAAANGRLTLVEGSPFKTSGEMIGSAGKYFITLGFYWVHVYAVEANGAIGKQVSSINTLDYSGGDCETYPAEDLVFGTDGAVLDHAGQNLYVFLNGNYDDGGGCAAFQTYNIAKSGELTFNTVDEWYTPAIQQPAGGLIITGNDKFGYGMVWNWGESETPYVNPGGYKRGSLGALDGMGFNELDPEPKPGWEFSPGCVNCSSSVVIMAADGTNHLAVALTSYSEENPYHSGTTQLASYTVDGEGNIASTNTWRDMPVGGPQGGQEPPAQSAMQISPSGKLLAVATDAGVPLQVFHFNGAEPITKFSGALTNLAPTQIGWDNDDHLYAIDGYGTGLYVWTITSTSIKAAPGSPYKIASEGGPMGSMVVVSK